MNARALPLVPLLITLGLALAAFYRLYHVLVPFILSLALAYVTNPIINNFEVRGLRRDLTVAAVYICIASVIVLLANTVMGMLAQELTLLQSQAPAYIARLRELSRDLQMQAASRIPYGSTIASHWDNRMYEPLIEQAQNIPTYLLGVFPLLSFLFLIPFITFFLLMDGETTIDKLIQACPGRYVEQALHLLSEIDTSLGDYLRGLVIVAAAITIASYVGLVAVGVNQALAIAVLSGVGSFVPYLGAATGALLGGTAAVFQFGTVAAGFKVILLFIAIQLAEEAVLEPFIAKHSVHLHPLTFLLALMLGGELFGFVGLLFAVPAACVLRSLVKVAWSWYATESRLQVSHAADAAAVPYT